MFTLYSKMSHITNFHDLSHYTSNVISSNIQKTSINLQTQINAKQGILSNSTDVTVKDLTTRNTYLHNGALFIYPTSTTYPKYLKIHSGPLSDSSVNSIQIGTILDSGAYISTGKSGDASDTPLSFKINNVEKMRIGGDGNVGIGTTTPTEKLEVNGSMKVGNRIITNYGGENGISFLNNTNDFGIYINSGISGVGFNGVLPCKGYGFTSTSIRLRTPSNSINGLIYETTDEDCKFSVRASDGLGYFKGGLVSESNVSVNGIANIHGGKSYAVPQGYMATGSLTIGDGNSDYGHGNGWNSSTSGLMMECKNNTEIAVHDSGIRLASLMAYTGSTNKITIGRDMGWGSIGSVDVHGNINVSGINPTISVLDTRENGNAILSLKEKNDNFGFDIAYIGNDDNKLYIRGYNSTTTPRTDMTLVRSNGNVGIGTTNPTEKLDVAGKLKLSGGIIINETIGTTRSSTNGTIVLNHENSGGHSSVVFTSRANRNSDYGYISYQDDVYNEAGKERSLLEIGTQNDGHNAVGDYIAIMPSAYCGIGTRTPTEKLEVYGNLRVRGFMDTTSTNFRFGYTHGRGLEHIWNYVTGTGRSCFFNWREGGSGGFDFKIKASNGADIGYANIHVGGTVPSSFTGVHICKSEVFNLYNDRYIGYIVSSVKKYKSINSEYDPSNIKQNIDKENNDCLPMVELTSKPNDKNVFGVISKIEDQNDTTRQQQTGGTTSIFKKESYDRSLLISGCGEGFLWVSDYNGPIEAGDLISSSPIPGIGMKQDDDVLRSYTVAKITMDCDFNPAYIPVKVLQSSNYDIEYTTTSNIVNTSNEYINIVETINTSNVTIYPRDENDRYIYVNKLDVNSNIIYDYEYEMKYVRLDGTITDENEYTNGSNVYRMALVGGCYKCS